ncbi:MAG: hypothetical protein U0746_20195 [Gemmataceae bacterium]
MSQTLAELIRERRLRLGQSICEQVNGFTVELRMLRDDEPTPELAEQVMLEPWFETPFDPVATVRAAPGPVPYPDPPLIVPDGCEE